MALPGIEVRPSGEGGHELWMLSRGSPLWIQVNLDDAIDFLAPYSMYEHWLSCIEREQYAPYVIQGISALFAEQRIPFSSHLSHLKSCFSMVPGMPQWLDHCFEHGLYNKPGFSAQLSSLRSGSSTFDSTASYLVNDSAVLLMILCTWSAYHHLPGHQRSHLFWLPFGWLWGQRSFDFGTWTARGSIAVGEGSSIMNLYGHIVASITSPIAELDAEERNQMLLLCLRWMRCWNIWEDEVLLFSMLERAPMQERLPREALAGIQLLWPESFQMASWLETDPQSFAWRQVLTQHRRACGDALMLQTASSLE